MNSRFVARVVSLSQSVKPPGLEGLSLYQVAKFFLESIQQGALVTRASAISFRIVMAIAPGLILLISIIPMIPIDNFQEKIMNGIQKLLPLEAYKLLEDTINGLFEGGNISLPIIGFVLVFYYASGAISSILVNFGSSIHLTTKRHPLIHRLISLVLMFAVSLIVISAVGMITLTGKVSQFLLDTEIISDKILLPLFYLIQYALIYFLFMLIISILYNVGNTSRKKFRISSAGANLSTILMILVSVGFAYYVNNFGNYNKLYGSLGAIIISLFWIYFNSLILLIGFELNTSISAAKTTHTAP